MTGEGLDGGKTGTNGRGGEVSGLDEDGEKEAGELVLFWGGNTGFRLGKCYPASDCGKGCE